MYNSSKDTSFVPKMSVNDFKSNDLCPKMAEKGCKCDLNMTYYLNMTIYAARLLFKFFYDNFVILLFTMLIIFVVYVIYKSYWSPVLYIKELTDVGFDHIPAGRDRNRNITRAQNARKAGTKLPPPYPNGWFALAESKDLKAGAVKAVDALGMNLCVYRGEDGIARCVDAYCPHLGANLGVGGSVCGDCIECPFHKWRFSAEGICVSVPGLDHAPRGVSIKTYRTVEADGAVWVWHDAEGREPLWTLEDHPELKDWGYRGRNEFTVSAHIQEIPENGADVAHLNVVHAASVMSNLGESFPILCNIIGRHVWAAEWNRGEDHRAHMILTHDYKILKFNFLHIDVQVTQLGPGHVRLLMQTPVGPMLVSQSVTPLAPMLQRVVHRVFSPAYNAPLAALLPISEGLMFERDINIWNNKRFVSAPAYVKCDKSIKAFRIWFTQFYSDNSVSFKEAMQNPLDW